MHASLKKSNKKSPQSANLNLRFSFSVSRTRSARFCSQIQGSRCQHENTLEKQCDITSEHAKVSRESS